MNKTIEQILLDLIAIRTTTRHPENFISIIDYVRNYYLKYDTIKMHYFDFFSAPALLVAKQLFTEYDIIFAMHLDVVEADNDQFIPYIKDGKVYGRGAADMKGSSAVIMKMYEELIDSGTADKIALLFTTDEESGSEEGKKAISDPRIKASCAIVSDTKSWGFDHLVNECKGLCFLRLSVQSVHPSEMTQGAIELLIEDLHKVRLLFENNQNQWGSTINIGRIEGGARTDFPIYAEAFIDIRMPDSESLESLLERIRAVLSYSTIEVIQYFPSVFIDENNKYFMAMKQIMEVELHKSIPVKKEEGSSDARFFALKNIPSILCKPYSMGMHLSEEWIDIESMYQYKEIFKKYCIQISGF